MSDRSTPLAVDRPRRLLALAAALLATGLLLGHGHADAVLLHALNAGLHAPAWWWAQATTLGLGASVVVIGTALAMVAGDARERLTLALAAAVPLAGMLTWGVKTAAALPRPAAVFVDGHLHVIGQALTSHTSSMPSGHTLAAVALAALWSLAASPRWQRALLTTLALLVALSRVVVGAHWPSDVLVGAALGVVTAVVAWRLGSWGCASRRRAAFGWVAAALPALAALWLLQGSHEQPQAEGLRHALAALGLLVAAAQAVALSRQPAARPTTPDGDGG